MILCIDDDNGTKLYIKKGCIYTDYESSDRFYELASPNSVRIKYFKT